MSAPKNGFIPLTGAILAALYLVGCGQGGAAAGGTAGSSGAVTSSGAAMVGGPFQLVNQDGKPVDQHVLDGKWSAVFFGYTYCPDVCPTTLQVLAQAKARLGQRAKALQVVFVSVDPGRDTPAQMKAYLATPSFPQPTLGLTGSAEQIAAVAKAYRVYYARQGTGEGYAMAHSSLVYLMNPRGKFASVLTDTQTPDQVAAQIGDAMKAGT